jgi:hypothetical protein
MSWLGFRRLQVLQGGLRLSWLLQYLLVLLVHPVEGEAVSLILLLPL